MVEELNEKYCEDDDELATLTQLVNTYVGHTPEELLVNFRVTRNALIKTRYLPCFEIAKELDRVIQALERGDLQLVSPYDHTRIFDLAEQILTKGENPQ